MVLGNFDLKVMLCFASIEIQICSVLISNNETTSPPVPTFGLLTADRPFQSGTIIRRSLKEILAFVDENVTN